MLAYSILAFGLLLFFVVLPIYVTSGICATCTRKILPWQRKHFRFNLNTLDTKAIYYHKDCAPRFS